MTLDWILAIIVACLMAVEIILIVSLLKLRKDINQLDADFQNYFGELFRKIKALVELFLQAQLGKLSDINVKSDKFEAGLHIQGKENGET